MANASPGPRDSPLVPAATPSHWAKTQTLCQLLILSIVDLQIGAHAKWSETHEIVRICLAAKEFELSSFKRGFHHALW
jgi:hypothetical protein